MTRRRFHRASRAPSRVSYRLSVLDVSCRRWRVNRYRPTDQSPRIQPNLLYYDLVCAASIVAASFTIRRLSASQIACKARDNAFVIPNLYNEAVRSLYCPVDRLLVIGAFRNLCGPREATVATDGANAILRHGTATSKSQISGPWACQSLNGLANLGDARSIPASHQARIQPSPPREALGHVDALGCALRTVPSQ